MKTFILLLLTSALSLTKVQAQYAPNNSVSKDNSFTVNNNAPHAIDNAARKTKIWRVSTMAVGGAFIATGSAFITLGSYNNFHKKDGRPMQNIGALTATTGLFLFAMAAGVHAHAYKTNPKLSLYSNYNCTGIAYNF